MFLFGKELLLHGSENQKKHFLFVLYLHSVLCAYFYNRLPNRKGEIAYNWYMQDIQTPENMQNSARLGKTNLSHIWSINLPWTLGGKHYFPMKTSKYKMLHDSVKVKYHSLKKFLHQTRQIYAMIHKPPRLCNFPLLFNGK